MENASKALIIAGAILIVIILISVGIMVMNSTSSPLSEVEKEGASQAAQMFNSKFTQYIGKNKSANEVKLLLDILTSTGGDNRITRIHSTMVIGNQSGTDVIKSYAIGPFGAQITNKKTYNVQMGTKKDKIKYAGSEFTPTEIANKKDGYLCWVFIDEN